MQRLRFMLIVMFISLISNGSFAGQVYDRVISSGTLKCGYIIYPPAVNKDPNTGKLSGVFYDLVNKMGENLKLKVEWTEEVGWGNMIEGLQAGRYDAVCTSIWANSARAKLVDFSEAPYYSGVGVWVRANDDRYKNKVAALNDPAVKISTLDGETGDLIARQDFAKAARVSLPQTSDISEVLLNVTTKKADVAFVENYIAEEFLKKNPGSIQNLATQKPVRIFPNTIMIARGDPELKAMLNNTMSELLNMGFIDTLFAKYSISARSFYKPALAYQP